MVDALLYLANEGVLPASRNDLYILISLWQKLYTMY